MSTLYLYKVLSPSKLSPLHIPLPSPGSLSLSVRFFPNFHSLNLFSIFFISNRLFPSFPFSISLTASLFFPSFKQTLPPSLLSHILLYFLLSLSLSSFPSLYLSFPRLFTFYLSLSSLYQALSHFFNKLFPSFSFTISLPGSSFLFPPLLVVFLHSFLLPLSTSLLLSKFVPSFYSLLLPSIIYQALSFSY